MSCHTRFKRKEIGIRISDDPVCQFLLNELQSPLLAGSVPEAAEDSFDIDFPTQQVSDNDSDESDSSGISDMSGKVSEKITKEKANVLQDLFRLNYMLNIGAASWYDKGNKL